MDKNDASRDQNPLASYGAANVAKLKAVARKYDPSQVFQKLQNDGFLLWKVDLEDREDGLGAGTTEDEVGL